MTPETIEKKYTVLFDKLLALSFKKLITDIKKGVPLTIIASQAEIYVDQKKNETTLFGLYQEAIKAGTEEFQVNLKNFDPQKFSQDIWLDDFWNKHAFAKLRIVTESNRLAIVEAVRKLESVEVLSENLIKTLSDLGTTISQARATRIVRTETTGAYNYGIFKASEDFGTGRLQAYWSSAKNERTRPTHREADGQLRGMDGYFKVGNAKLRFPGDPECNAVEEIVNCRCRINFRR